MPPKAKTIARRLLRENLRNERSWRRIAREDFNAEIAPGTLCRFALSKGEWTPKDERLQVLLGLKRERKQNPQRAALFEMTADALRNALAHREEMPAPDPRVMKAFVKAGLLKRSWVTR